MGAARDAMTAGELYRADAPELVTEAAATEAWLHIYNHHRAHSSLAGHPPISRVTNLPGQYS